MPPPIAALIFTVGVFGLFVLERRKDYRTSGALWIPVVYFFLIASRPVSMWLNLGGGVASPDQLLEGSPIDRAVFALLQALALVVLLTRAPQVGRLLGRNIPIVLYLAYCLSSILWSDYPSVAVKRWVKLAGDLMMVLVVLTDPRPRTALKRFLVWPSFLLIPISVLFIKYYPHLGRGYSGWTGEAYYTGISYNKNLLGAMCLFWGVGCLWLLSDAFHDRPRKARTLLTLGVILVMALWLLNMANSATSLSCFVAGVIILFWARSRRVAQYPILIHVVVLAILLGSFSVLFLDLGGFVLATLERDTTLTGRTELWDAILTMTDNPVVGAGYESFWLGRRLEKLWSVYWWRPNQAHNGYIEIFINLGWIGVALLAIVLLSAYRGTIRAVQRREHDGTIRLAWLVMTVMYNYTEASFRMQNLAWIFLLFALIGLPKPRLAPRPVDETESSTTPSGTREVSYPVATA